LDGSPITKEIKFELRRRNISQEVVAKYVGVSRVTVNRYLNGRRVIDSETFVKIIHLIGWKIDRGVQYDKYV